MSNLSHDKILLNENIDDIFEQKIEVGAVIQFDLLQRLIEEFIKRQKTLNDKVNNLELIIYSSSGPFNNTVIEENKLDESKTSLDYKSSKEIIIKEKENKDENKNLTLDNIAKTEKEEKQVKTKKEEKQDKPEKEEKQVKQEKEEKQVKPEKEEKQVKSEKIKSEEDDNKVEQHNKKELIHNQYRILSSRFDKFEKNLIELTKKVNNLNETDQHKEQNEKYDKLIKKQDEKIEKLENDINYLNQKIKEMNIIQVEYSNDNKDESEDDKNKNAQIMKMLTKKIDLMENKSKKNDEDIFKLKKDLTGINNLLSSDKNSYNEFSNEINKNYNKFIVAVNKDINSLKNLMSEKDEKIKNDLTNKFEKENNNIKKMVDELKNNINTYIEDNIIDNIVKSSKFNEKLNILKKDLKDLMKQNITETEKNIKSLINSLGIENIKKQISSIQENLSEKLIKADLDYIDLKFKDIEKSFTSQSLRLDELEKDLIECNNTCNKSVKMLEYLSGHVIQNDEPEKKIEQKEEINKKNLFTLEEKDLQFFVNKDEFNQEIKKLYAKIEQILLVESENYKFIQYVESRLKYFVTQKDFKLMEKCLINMLEELKINFARKYMEKSEILKNIKLLELQLKNFQDSNPGLIKEGDNWLLAKKPMNNYLCASCEAYIGELKNKNNYLAWNKIPPHDINTKYRMGNGFSRMLELVNTDIIKNAEKINNNLIIKDEKKINYDNIYPLPRVGSQINLKKLNKKISTFYANNENIEKKLNNSMDGVDNNNDNELNTSLKNNKKARNKNLRQNSEGKFLSDFGAVTSSYDRDFNYPQLLKIIKKTKKDI